MLKSGKLKLSDDMIVTAQEASNKAETVFTIYDDTTNTQIASGPIGGGGGEWNPAELITIETKNDINGSKVLYELLYGAYKNNTADIYDFAILYELGVAITASQSESGVADIYVGNTRVTTLELRFNDGVLASSYTFSDTRVTSSTGSIKIHFHPAS